jgi:hypothetical protein
MNDWIRLLVKYKGKCSACGKEIPPGQYALWSKGSKAIKHDDCSTSQITTTTTEKRLVVTNNRQQSVATKVNCFICGRPVSSNDSEFVEADGYSTQAISQASICNECLEDKNAYQNYQHAFNERVRRIAKVKLE